MRFLPKLVAIARDYLLMMVGAVCIALSVDLFLAPNHVVTGGLTGVAMILNDLLGWPIGLVILVANVPLLAFGLRYLGGWVFGVRTIFATVALSLAIDLLAPYVGRWMQAPRDPLLYTLYGGVLDGVGVGLVFRAQGTTGGVDIIARFLRRWYGVQMGRSILIMNVIVFAGAAYLFSFDKVLYALLVAFVSGRVIDLVLEGSANSHQAIIITQEPECVRAAIIERLDRSITMLEGQGGYSGEGRAVLLAVVARSEISLLKAIVQECDPAAFVVLSSVNEVLGEGFKPAIG